MMLYSYHKKETEDMRCSQFEELNIETLKDVYGGLCTWSSLGKAAIDYGAVCWW